MLSNKLINREDVATYKQISYTVHDDKFNEILFDTQIQDIAPLLGERLFNDILENTDNYNDLLDGGLYTCNDISYQNYGLKAVVVYYFDARYKMFGSAVDTPFSLVEKLDNEGKSQPASYKLKESMYQLNRDSAFTIWKSVENYLIRTDNELFRYHTLGYGCETKRNQNQSFKIKNIR